MAIVETEGLSDRSVYAQVMTNLRAAYDNYGVGNGNYPNVKDILTDRVLDNVWMRQLLNAKIYADGLGFTSRTAQAKGASSVRVPIMAPPAYAPRTISLGVYPGTVLPGTPNNDGLENTELPEIPQTNGIDINFTQLYDKAHVIYELSQDMVSLPLAAERTRQIPNAVANMEDSLLLATQLVGGLARAAGTDNSNIIPFNPANADNQGYMGGIMNALIGAMTNPQTSWSEGMVQYDLQDSVIMVKQSFWDRLFRAGNGIILGAGDLPQKFLLGGGITDDGKIIGRNIRGVYAGVYIKVVPDSYWRQAAAYAGITASNFAQFDKVQAFIANAEGTAFGRASMEVNPIPNPGNAIGTKIQNLWRWGAGVTRGSSIALVVSTENNLADFTNPISSNGTPIVAPASFNNVIRSYGYANADYGTGSKVQVVSPSDCVVTLTIAPNTLTSASGITVTAEATIGNELVQIPVSVNATASGTDNTATFVVQKNSPVKVVVGATGYTSQTVSVTATNTANATYAKTVTLVSAG